jgi:hypothetical protein
MSKAISRASFRRSNNTRREDRRPTVFPGLRNWLAAWKSCLAWRNGKSTKQLQSPAPRLPHRKLDRERRTLDSQQREDAFGNATNAKQQATQALKLYPASQGVEVESALAFAMAGDAERARGV